MRADSRVSRLILLFSLCAFGCGGGGAAPGTQGTSPTPIDPQRGGVLRVAIWQEPSVLNPLLSNQTTSAVVARTFLEGLLSIQPDGTRAAQLAERVPSLENGDVSADGLMVTWHLRRGVLWSDGEPFTSKDVLFTYSVVMNPANQVANRAGYPDIESITPADDYTIVIRYRALYGSFKTHFAWLLPEHAFGGEPAIEGKELSRTPIGTGPFLVSGWSPGESISLERNPNYREVGKPFLDGIVFRIVPNRDISMLWLRSGDADLVWNVSEDVVRELATTPGVNANAIPSRAIERLILNVSCPTGAAQGDPSCSHPLLGDLRVRQAIELSIDKRSIVAELLAAQTTLPPSVIPAGPYETSLPESDFDPVRARQLLADSSWGWGPDGIAIKGVNRLSLSFTTTSGDRLREQTQQLIQSQLREVGIEVRIENLPSPVLLGSWQDAAPRARGNVDILMYALQIGEDPYSGLYTSFHSASIPSDQNRSGGNYHRIADPDIDAALESAGKSLDERVRKDSFATVARRVDSGKGHILLYRHLNLDPAAGRVRGTVPNVWSDFTWNSQEWSLAT